MTAFIERLLGRLGASASGKSRAAPAATLALADLGGTCTVAPVALTISAPGAPATGTVNLPAGAVLAALAPRLSVTKGAMVLALHTAAGKLIDHVVCPAYHQPYEPVFFTPDVTGPVSLSLHARDGGEGVIDCVTLAAFDAEAVNPARLMPPPLAKMPHWERFYGPAPYDDAAARLRDHVFKALPAPICVPWIKNLQIFLEPGDEGSRILFLSGIYEPESLTLLEKILPIGGTFVDIGANCGFYTLVGARLVGESGRVIAFEPSPREFARLEGNIGANRLQHVTLVKAAAGKNAETAALRIAEKGHAGHNTLGSRFAYSGVKTDTTTRVDVVRLDDVLHDIGASRCDVIKLDIEGSELRALQGARETLRQHKPKLLIELFDSALGANGSSAAQLLAWLDEQGYRVHDIDPETGAAQSGLSAPLNVPRNIIAIASAET